MFDVSSKFQAFASLRKSIGGNSKTPSLGNHGHLMRTPLGLFGDDEDEPDFRNDYTLMTPGGVEPTQPFRESN